MLTNLNRPLSNHNINTYFKYLFQNQHQKQHSEFLNVLEIIVEHKHLDQSCKVFVAYGKKGISSLS